MKIGDHVHIGANSIVEAATIGNHVEIGKNCIIVSPHWSLASKILNPWHVQGKFTIIKDCARIADNTVIPPNTVVPALALFAGSPGMLTSSSVRATLGCYAHANQADSSKTSLSPRLKWLKHRQNSTTPAFNLCLQNGSKHHFPVIYPTTFDTRSSEGRLLRSVASLSPPSAVVLLVP